MCKALTKDKVASPTSGPSIFLFLRNSFTNILMFWVNVDREYPDSIGTCDILFTTNVWMVPCEKWEM